MLNFKLYISDKNCLHIFLDRTAIYIKVYMLIISKCLGMISFKSIATISNLVKRRSKEIKIFVLSVISNNRVDNKNLENTHMIKLITTINYFNYLIVKINLIS